MIYANHAGTSWPKPPEVRRAVAETLEADPRTWGERFEAARAAVCGFLGIPAAQHERFLFTSGCTAALAVVLEDLPWRDGDVVLTSSVEHHALGRPVERLKASRGVLHVAVPYHPGRPLDLDFVRDALRRGGVRLVAATAASNVTGERLPVEDLARMAHDHDALCLVDAAQTAGVVPLDVAGLGADIVVFAGHKGPHGPQGVGGLWAAPHVFFESPGAVCEIDSGGRGRACASFPTYCDVGSANLAGTAGLAAGFRWLAAGGEERAGGRARRLAARLRDGLRERPSCSVHGGETSGLTAAVSLTIEGLELEHAEALFRELGIVVRAGSHCSPMALEALDAPAGTLRISFGPTNRDGDPQAILEAIDRIAARAWPRKT
jgi:cysteine desulfurase/selenocysteine lyase